jgi:hypothetical protein
MPARALAQDCINPDCRPDVIPAAGRDHPPLGFHKETRRFQGPLIGAAACGVGGGAMIVIAMDPRGDGGC